MHSHFLHNHRHNCNRCHDSHSRKWHSVRMDCVDRMDDDTNHRSRLQLKNIPRSGCKSLYNWWVRAFVRTRLFFFIVSLCVKRKKRFANVLV